jgi:glycosyltransferase involved in cell wall biosynthesis
VQISATLIALDEQKNIARAIESLRCCDEVVVVDAGSTDRTAEIASRLGARVIESPWSGYAAQKNLAAEKANHDWILSIDADEALSEALEAEIWQIKKNGPRYDAYTVPRLAQYMGRWILHSGWYPDRKVRFYDRRKCRWVGNFVHESVQVNGTIGHLRCNLLHFTCDSMSDHLKRLDRYTTLAAEELVSRGQRVRWTHLVLDPLWTFLRTYFFQAGFLDGAEGLTIASMAAFYNFVKFTKARNMSSHARAPR